RRLRLKCCFFFSSRRRHTRFSRDWSSDVCSSDLDGFDENGLGLFVDQLAEASRVARVGEADFDALLREGMREQVVRAAIQRAGRSEERRVGKECRSGWGPEHEKNKGMRRREVSSV